ncbi:hypothetical protein PRIPAC_77675 [Pristionchus pacificus]|uniref:Uncharacterized protein n=1 Tax=Pristionchus pacificus TaxID=54126 RepID=A0A2A6BI32_PRIPA|nr:hypothetical protein PRIPAC_77675 [Pristionchus pacificus]|eukprot:PDM65570.1 hypothetical protein PRIPAC_52512 [Pristionchus pacificus]
MNVVSLSLLILLPVLVVDALTKNSAFKIMRFLANGDKDKEAQLRAAIPEIEDAGLNAAELGFFVQMKDIANSIFRPGGIRKTLSHQDIIDQARKEATRTNDLIEQLSASIKNATYKGIIKNTKVLEKSFAGLFKCSTEESYKDTLEKLLITMKEYTKKIGSKPMCALQLRCGRVAIPISTYPMKDPEHDPHIMTQNLEIMVTTSIDNVLQLTADSDDFCTEQALIEAQVANCIASIRVIVEEKENLVNENGIESIARIVVNVQKESTEFIVNFKSSINEFLTKSITLTFGHCINLRVKGFQQGNDFGGVTG